MTKQLQLSSQYAADGLNVAFFNAQIQEDGTCTTNRMITDEASYRAHREDVNQAFSDFEEEAFEIADRIKGEGI